MWRRRALWAPLGPCCLTTPHYYARGPRPPAFPVAAPLPFASFLTAPSCMLPPLPIPPQNDDVLAHNHLQLQREREPHPIVYRDAISQCQRVLNPLFFDNNNEFHVRDADADHLLVRLVHSLEQRQQQSIRDDFVDLHWHAYKWRNAHGDRDSLRDIYDNEQHVADREHDAIQQRFANSDCIFI